MRLTPAQQAYREYLQTPHWQSVRNRIVARADEHCEWCGRFCGSASHHPEQWCGLIEECEWCRCYFDEDGWRNDSERQRLEVHHVTYERVGAERDEDLLALCWSCHDGFTERAAVLRGMVRSGRIPKEFGTVRMAMTCFWPIVAEALARRSRRISALGGTGAIDA